LLLHFFSLVLNQSYRKTPKFSAKANHLTARAPTFASWIRRLGKFCLEAVYASIAVAGGTCRGRYSYKHL
jgi:hypothetical protein